MCDAPTLTTVRREAMEQRLRAAQATINADAALAAVLAAWEQAVVPAGKSITALGLQGIDDAGKLRFTRLLGNSAHPAPFLVAHDEMVRARRELGQALRNGNELGRTTKERSARPDSLPALIRERQVVRDAIATATEDFFHALDSYTAAWNEIADAVIGRIAADDAVARIDAVGKALRALSEADVLSRYAKVLDETQELIRSVESAVQTKQTDLLRDRGKEVKDILPC